MQLSDLYLYPIKSTAPLPVCEARVEPCGLQHDRRWMVVDADGRLLVFAVQADRVPADGTEEARDALDALAARLAQCGCR